MSRRLKAPLEIGEQIGRASKHLGTRPRGGSRTNPHPHSTQQDLVDKSGKCLGTIPDGAAHGSLAPTVYLRRGRDNPTPIPVDLKVETAD